MFAIPEFAKGVADAEVRAVDQRSDPKDDESADTEAEEAGSDDIASCPDQH